MLDSADAPFPLELIERIHAAAPRMVMEFAGAGSQALWWLHRVAGSSRTLLEATDRYSPPSLIEAVGFVPERFTSPAVATGLARHALTRARSLAPGEPVFGLGLSATIATDRAKRGEHRCELAVHDTFGGKRYGLELRKGERDRAGEERLIAQLLLRAVADASGVLGAEVPALSDGEELVRALEPEGVAAEFASGKRPWLLMTASGELRTELPDRAAILSGSFNPLHDGHRRLAAAAEERLGAPVLFELPLVNADKAEIGLAEARRRAGQFLGGAPLLLTRSPLFNEKARLFPGRTFVIGVDTAARLLEPRFYGSEEARFAAFEELRTLGARFLVAGRRRDGRFLTLANLGVPAPGISLFDELPEQEFREDLSSSQLRSEWPQSAAGEEGS